MATVDATVLRGTNTLGVFAVILAVPVVASFNLDWWLTAVVASATVGVYARYIVMKVLRHGRSELTSDRAIIAASWDGKTVESQTDTSELLRFSINHLYAVAIAVHVDERAAGTQQGCIPSVDTQVLAAHGYFTMGRPLRYFARAARQGNWPAGAYVDMLGMPLWPTEFLYLRRLERGGVKVVRSYR